jgi:Golgi apparatus protein 1
MSLKSISIFALLSLAVAVSASADKMSDQKNLLQSACQSDLQNFCKDVTPGDHRAMSCLKAHEDQLSSGCSTEWVKQKAAWKQTMRDGRNACSGDVQKFCSNVTGPKEVASCLSTHSSDLSSSCASFTQAHQQMGGQAKQDDVITNPSPSTTNDSVPNPS